MSASQVIEQASDIFDAQQVALRKSNGMIIRKSVRWTWELTTSDDIIAGLERLLDEIPHAILYIKRSNYEYQRLFDAQTELDGIASWLKVARKR